MASDKDHSGESEQRWRQLLTAQEYAVLREAATEPAGSGEYVETTTVGTYHCRACGKELFASATKFAAHCGWPAFWAPLIDAEGAAVTLHSDTSHGMTRTEVRCAGCDSHLGHVFAGEGYDTPTDQRFCINSLSLRLRPE